jgi:hypothetical protein
MERYENELVNPAIFVMNAHLHNFRHPVLIRNCALQAFDINEVGLIHLMYRSGRLAVFPAVSGLNLAPCKCIAEFMRKKEGQQRAFISGLLNEVDRNGQEDLRCLKRNWNGAYSFLFTGRRFLIGRNRRSMLFSTPRRIGKTPNPLLR